MPVILPKTTGIVLFPLRSIGVKSLSEFQYLAIDYGYVYAFVKH